MMIVRKPQSFQLWAMVLTLVVGGHAYGGMGPRNYANVAKKTLCTMTINSVQEKDLFRKFLPKKDWNIVELVPETAPGLAWLEAWNQQSWFKKACEKRVQCDALVISGHFAGSFFGRSGYSLSLEEMERASCDSSCDGIFKRPKEIYLFGCNTLADKSRDHRSPEDYVAVLRADGFSTEEAHAVAMQRYTPWGASNAERMRALFPKAPGLYGFNSTSPLGKVIEPALAGYLKKRGPQFGRELEQMRAGDINNDLAAALKKFSYTQAAAGRGETPLVCQLSAPQAKNDQLIFDQLISKEPLRNLPQILQSLREMAQTDPQQVAALARRLENHDPEVRLGFAKMFANEELRAHLSIRLGLIELQLLLFTGGKPDAALAKAYQDLAKSALAKVSEHTARDFCSPAASGLVRSFELPASMVEETAKRFATSKAKTELLFGALSCLRTEVKMSWLTGSYPSSFLFAQIWNMQLAELKASLLAAKTPEEQNRLLGLLLSASPWDADIERLLDRRLARPESRIETLKVLGLSPRISEEWQLRLAEKTAFGEGDDDEAAWIVFWRQIRPSSAAVQRALHAGALKEREAPLLLSVFSSTRVSAEVLTEWVQRAESGDAAERSFNLHLLARLSPEGDGLYDIGLRRLKDSDPRVRVEAASLMLRFFSEAIDAELENRMRDMLRDRSADIVGLSLRFWAKRGGGDEKLLNELFEVWVRAEKGSEIRSVATDVLEHLSIDVLPLLLKIESRLTKAGSDADERGQLRAMLAAAQWGTLKTPEGRALAERLKKSFTDLVKSADDEGRIIGRKALLRNTKPDAAFLSASAKDLAQLTESQNWMGARILAYELEAYRSSTVVERALKLFQREIDGILEGDL